MTQLCQLQRDANAGVSDDRNYSNQGSPVMCRVWTQMGAENVSGEEVAVVENWRAVVPTGTNVLLTDRITSVKDRQGNELEPNRVLEVQAILRKLDHIELILEEIKH